MSKDLEIFNHVKGQLNQWIIHSNFESLLLTFKNQHNEIDFNNIVKRYKGFKEYLKKNNVIQFDKKNFNIYLNKINKEDNYNSLLNSLSKETTFDNVEYNKILIIFLFKEFNYSEVKHLLDSTFLNLFNEKKFTLLKTHLQLVEWSNYEVQYIFLKNNIFDDENLQTLAFNSLLTIKLNYNIYNDIIVHYSDSPNSQFYILSLIYSLIKDKKNNLIKEIISKVDFPSFNQSLIAHNKSLFHLIKLTITNSNFEIFHLLYNKYYESMNNLESDFFINLIMFNYSDLINCCFEFKKLLFLKTLFSKPLSNISYQYDYETNSYTLSIKKLVKNNRQ